MTILNKNALEAAAEAIYVHAGVSRVYARQHAASVIEAYLSALPKAELQDDASAVVIRPDIQARRACDDASILVFLLKNDFIAEILSHLNNPRKIEHLVAAALDMVEEIQETLAHKTPAKVPE